MSVMMEVEEYCLCCGKRQRHRLIYVGQPEKGKIYLRKAVCQECGNALEMDRLDILESYSKEMVGRILTKPVRVFEEFEEDPCTLIKNWPRRFLTKPYRVAKELFEIVSKN